MKGKEDLIPVWVATGARSRYGSDLDLRPQAAFIGRTVELTLLQQTYLRAVGEPSVQLVTVTGEPGVGKSRLAREFFTFIDGRPELVWWRQGRCLPYGDGITFWALGEIVKAQIGVLESDGPDEAASKLGESVAGLIQDEADREWVRARLGALVGATGQEGSAPADRAESFAGWRRFLEALAGVRPLVLVFEDLHWADQAMVEFIDHLVDWSTGVPMVVLCTARPELYEREPGWGGGKRNSATISLSPLSEDESARLISSLLSEAVLPAETQTALLERAGGNPLYAEEFVRMLTDRGILRRDGRAWRIDAGEDIPVPDTVQSLIAARLDTLPPERKSLLHDAAVVGKVFWSGALASMGERDEHAVVEGLHELSRKELVRPSRTSSVHDQAEFSFWHALVRGVAYAQIPRAARAAKHRAAAAWIERLGGDRVTDHAEVLAHHYGEALELTRAAGDEAEAADLEEPARRFLAMAGDRALRLDMSGAERFSHQALDSLPAGHPDRPALLGKLGRAAQLAGRVTEGHRDFELALEEAGPDGEPILVGMIMSELAVAKWRLGNTAGGATLLDEAIELLERQRPGPELAAAYVSKAGRYMLMSEPEPTLEWTEKALSLAGRFGLENQRVRLRQYRGMARWALGDLGGGEDLREALRSGLEIGVVYETTTAFTNLADFVWLEEGPRQGLEMQRRGIEFAGSRGHIQGALWLQAETTWLLCDAGDWDQLLETADAVIAADQEREGSNITDLVTSYRAKVLVNRGDVAGAADMVERFLPRARENGEPQILHPALVVAALVRRAQGATDAALALIEELQRETRGGWCSEASS